MKENTLNNYLFKPNKYSSGLIHNMVCYEMIFCATLWIFWYIKWIESSTNIIIAICRGNTTSNVHQIYLYPTVSLKREFASLFPDTWSLLLTSCKRKPMFTCKIQKWLRTQQKHLMSICILFFYSHNCSWVLKDRRFKTKHVTLRDKSHFQYKRFNL